jgi:hypothetical protein
MAPAKDYLLDLKHELKASGILFDHSKISYQHLKRPTEIILILTFTFGAISGGISNAVGEDFWAKFKKIYFRIIRKEKGEKEVTSLEITGVFYPQESIFHWPCKLPGNLDARDIIDKEMGVLSKLQEYVDHIHIKGDRQEKFKHYSLHFDQEKISWEQIDDPWEDI